MCWGNHFSSAMAAVNVATHEGLKQVSNIKAVKTEGH